MLTLINQSPFDILKSNSVPMAKLLTVIKEPAFNWYPKWIELDEKGQPKNPIKDGMSQPPTIKILWSTPSGRETSCAVTPDKGWFGHKYVLS
jgi:hypothetical protein